MKILIWCVVLGIAISSYPVLAQRAGDGSYQTIVVKREGAKDDGRPFSLGEDYIRIESSTWYVNAQSNVLRDRMVSGTVNVQVGSENFESVLPLYDLSGGTRTAPLFNRTVLYNRVYPGGNIRMQIFIAGIKKDTKLGGLLRTLASTAVDIGIGKIGTATAIGTNPALAAASQTLSNGVQEILKTGESQHGIFQAGNGLEYTFQDNFTGEENFLLAYRGNTLDRTKIKVVDAGYGTYEVTHNGSPITGGAWVLFRISREAAYKDSRPWRSKANAAKTSLDELMQDWNVGAKTKAEVDKALTATVNGSAVADRILAVRSEINADVVLTPIERARFSGELVQLLLIAQKAAKASNAVAGVSQYTKERDQLRASLKSGSKPSTDSVHNTFMNELKIANGVDETAYVRSITTKFANINSALSERMKSVRSIADIQRLAGDSILETIPQNRRDELRRSSEVSKPRIQSDEDIWKHFGSIEKAYETQTTVVGN